MNCISSKIHTVKLTSSTQNVALSENRVIADIISKEKAVLDCRRPPSNMIDVLIKRGNLDTDCLQDCKAALWVKLPSLWCFVKGG